MNQQQHDSAQATNPSLPEGVLQNGLRPEVAATMAQPQEMLPVVADPLIGMQLQQQQRQANALQQFF